MKGTPRDRLGYRGVPVPRKQTGNIKDKTDCLRCQEQRNQQWTMSN